MMIIFWDKYGILLIEYLPGETTIICSYYASIIGRLRCVILKKRHGKISRGALCYHDSGIVHKCNIVQAAIRKASFVELNHSAYPLDIAPTNYHPLSTLKTFLRDKNFSRDDETIDTVEDCLNRLD